MSRIFSSVFVKPKYNNSKRLGTILTLVFLGACSSSLLAGYPTLEWPAPDAGMYLGPILGDPGAPRIINVTVTMHPSNSLIFNFHVTLDRPAQVWVEYQPANGNSPLRTALTTVNTSHDLQVMRLKADTDYCYQVFAVTREEDRAEALNTGGLVSDPVYGSFRTGPLPAGLVDASFIREFGEQTYDITLLDLNNDGFDGYVAIDKDADVVWYNDAAPGRSGVLVQKPNYNLVYLDEYGLREITPAGDVIDQLDDCTVRPRRPPQGFHHDVILGPNDTVLFLASEIHDAGEPYGLQTSDTIAVWDQNTGDSRVLFDVYDVIPVTDRTEDSDATDGFFWRGCPPMEGPKDWTHANTLFLGARGNLLMSLRHLDQIISVAPDFKSLEWRLGGPGGDFTFPDPRDRFYHQHSVKLLPNGHLLLFDNGNSRPAAEGGEYSRALELELDFEAMEARKVWEYRFSPDLFAGCCSSVARLANGNTVVAFGCDPNFVYRLVEADREGRAVSIIRIFSPGQRILYRAYPLASINGESARLMCHDPDCR